MESFMSIPHHVRAMSLLGPLASAKDKGVDTTKLLSDLGVSFNLLNQEESLIHETIYLNFLEQCNNLTQDDLFSFRVGLDTELSNYGLFGQAILSASTVQEALDFGCYTLHYLQDGGNIRITKCNGQCTLHYQHKFTDALGRNDVDHTIGAFTNLLLNAKTDRSINLQLYFPAAQSFTLVIRSHTVNFTSSDQGMISFDEELLSYRMPEYNPLKVYVAERFNFFYALLSSHKRESYHQLVGCMLRAIISIEKPSLENVSRRLQVSERKLQRKIALEGVTFRDLLQETRKELALRYISQGEVITDVAMKLGYEYPGNFTAAFQRWYGYPPSKYVITS